MTQKNCHTCKGVYTENQKKFYCNITGKKPNDANLLLKWYEDHEVSKPDLPCKDYAESISKQDAKHTPAGHAAHDPYGYYDNLCGFLKSYYQISNSIASINTGFILHKFDMGEIYYIYKQKGYLNLIFTKDGKVFRQIKEHNRVISHGNIVLSVMEADGHPPSCWTDCKEIYNVSK